MRRWVLVGAAIAVIGCFALLLAACSSEPSQDSITVGTADPTVEVADPTDVATETAQEPPSLYIGPWENGEQASIETVVSFDPDLECVYLGGPGGRRRLPQWPPGYELDFDPIRVVGPGGNPTFYMGDRIVAAGGERGLASVPVTVNRCGAEGVWFLGGIGHAD